MSSNRSTSAWLAAAAFAGLLLAGGCGRFPFFGPGADAPGGPPTAGFLSVAQVAPTLGIGDSNSAPVRVRLRNPSAFDASARITMRVGGVVVHFTSNRVPAGTESMLVGPDRADSVLVELFIETDPPQSPPPRVFFLGADFQANDTIEIVVQPILPPDDDDDDPNKPPPPPPAPLAGEIDGLDTDIKIAAGSIVQFEVVLESFISAAPVIRAFADPDANPNNGNEIVISPPITGGLRTPVAWNTAGLAPGLYTIFADVTDGSRQLRVGPAAGRVRINASPLLVFDSPIDGLAVTIGQTFIIGWAGQDPDDDAKIRILLDPDGELNGNELLLRDAVSEDDVNDRQVVVATGTLAAGSYRVVGQISDGFESLTVVGATVCLTERFVGPLTVAMLGPQHGMIRSLSAEAPEDFVLNVALGWSVDIGRDVNGDGRADLLVGDPLALVSDPDTGIQPRGVAYFHAQGNGAWGGERTVDQLRTRLRTIQSEGRFGAAVALAGGIDADPLADVLIGAPSAAYDSPDGSGLVRVVDGRFTSLVINRQVQTDWLGPPQVGVLVGDGDYKAEGEALGSRVAAIGDVDGNGYAEAAVAALDHDNQRGRVAIIAGGSGIGITFVDSLPWAKVMWGNLLVGEQPGDLAGAGLASTTGFLCSSVECVVADLFVGAPGANGSTGIVYAIAGDSDWFKYPSLGLGAIGKSLSGVLFVGENSGDLAGFSIAAGDVNGDGAPDLIIGAPGYDGGRGRVYVVYHSDAVLAAMNGAPLALASVGGSLPGIILDGDVPGGLFGWSVAAGDFDGDEAADVAVGAPNVGNGAGAGYLVYGGASLPGQATVSNLATCTFQGWSIAGEQAGSHLGHAVSAGDLTGDGRADFAFGAPGNGDTEGDVRGALRLVLSSGPVPNPPKDKPPPDTTNPGKGGATPPGNIGP